MCNKQIPADSDITIEKTQHIKAIALILLMWHHLFGCGFISDWLSPFKDVEKMIGVSAGICRAIFLFCSGYGFYRSYISKKSVSKTYTLKKIVGVLIPYWLVMITAIICLAILRKFEPRYIPGNLFCWILDDNLYVTFAWYVKLYLILVMILPLIRLAEKKCKKNFCLDFTIYIVLPFVLFFVFRGYMDEKHFKNIFHTVISASLMTMYWFPLFGVGLLFAKYEFYSKIQKFSEKIPKRLLFPVLFLICGNVLILRYLFEFESVTEVIYSPLFIIPCLLIFDNIKHKSNYVMPYLGDKSIFYWLLSSMFFKNTSELLPAITWPRVSVLILIWSILLLTPFVFAYDRIANQLTTRIFNRR